MRSIWSLGILLALAGPVAAREVSAPGTYTYTDVLRPHGQARSFALKAADARRCDGGNSAVIGTPAFDACMQARGWRMTSFVPARQAPVAEAAASNPWGDNNVWTDLRKRPRSDGTLRADTDACIAQTGPDPVGQVTSPAMKECMLASGWRFERTDGSGAFIDPETGLECRNNGFASVCGPPQGTVTYVDRHGLNCRRTGIVAVCTNL